MNIVVLDGYTLNPGDLSWDELAELGSLTVYERTAPEDVVTRAHDAELVLTNKTPLTRTMLEALPKLRYIGVLATGYNVVDIQAAGARGIIVTNVPTYGTSSVAQLVLALLLELCHQTGAHDAAVKAGEWATSDDFCFTKAPLVELEGKTLGLIGLGRIGAQTARVAQALGMRVIATGSRRSAGAPSPVEGVPYVPLEELLRQADVVSLHCPLTPETKELVNAERLALMKPSALLINTSRGGLIDEQALADALNDGRLAGAALDVLSTEPPAASNPLLSAARCIITPHIAWATKEARTRLMHTAVANAAAFLDGQPVHIVNREALATSE